MRLFVALELSDAVRDAISAAVQPLRASMPELAWLPRGRLHLTLRFLGEVADERLGELRELCGAVAARQRSFPLSLSGVGAFPTFRRARVLWWGVEPDARLELLSHDLEMALGEIGYEVEGRPFRPHITVARVREPLPVERARRLARGARRIQEELVQDVRELALVESRLAPTGARYRRELAAPFGGR